MNRNAFEALQRHFKLFAASAVFVCLAPLPFNAYAQSTPEVQEVSRLLKAGQLDAAIQKADSFLASKPRDAQMRFLKGLILTEQNKTVDAIQTFQRLTEDYPELPEPYNNLAVLYAAQGQYDKARASLEMAIRTHPSYATAHENLGDVYAKLASQAYDKALQLDGGNSAAQTKLALVRDLIGGGKNRPSALPTKTPAPVVASAANAPVAATPVPAPKAAEVKPTEVKQTKPTVSSGNDEQEILNSVRNWARAWSERDTAGYLAFYGKDFDPPKGMSRKAWEQERRERIEGKGRIEVKVENPSVQIEGNTAKVKFRQLYRSDKLKTQSTKTLVLGRQNGKWLIQQERSGG